MIRIDEYVYIFINKYKSTRNISSIKYKYLVQCNSIGIVVERHYENTKSRTKISFTIAILAGK